MPAPLIRHCDQLRIGRRSVIPSPTIIDTDANLEPYAYRISLGDGFAYTSYAHAVAHHIAHASPYRRRWPEHANDHPYPSSRSIGAHCHTFTETEDK